MWATGGPLLLELPNTLPDPICRERGAMPTTLLVLRILVISCLVVPSLATPCLATDDPVATTFWTTGSALMPGWGLYPNIPRYGRSEVLETRQLGEQDG